MADADVFPFRFDRRFVMPLAMLGVLPATTWVRVDDRHLAARYGPWHLRTPLDNIGDLQVTRDYRWFRAIGPRGSLADGGATFGTNTRAGLCICFRERVGILLGPRLWLHPSLTVTVADVDGLEQALRSRGVPREPGNASQGTADLSP